MSFVAVITTMLLWVVMM